MRLSESQEWQGVAFVKDAATRPATTQQLRKYEAVRAGRRAWSNDAYSHLREDDHPEITRDLDALEPPRQYPAADLLNELDLLRVDRQLGEAAFYQYVVLLWTCARAVNDAPRLGAFSEASGVLRRALEPFGVGETRPDPASPWVALNSSSWWEIELPADHLIKGMRRRDIARKFDPRAGLSAIVYDLVRSDAGFLGDAVEKMGSLTHRTAEFNTLVLELGLPRQSATPGGLATAAADETSGSRTDGPARVARLIPLERQWTEIFDVAATAASSSERRESALQGRFCLSLEAAGHVVGRYEIPLPDEPNWIVTDVFDITNRELIEVKATADRSTVRAGLGQILDYSRFVDNATYALLLPSKPVRDLIDLLHVNGISVIWEEEAGRFVRSDLPGPGTTGQRGPQ